jgi:hypothetical protein
MMPATKISLVLLLLLLSACEPEVPPVAVKPQPTPVPGQPAAVVGTPVPVPMREVQILITDAAVRGLAGANVSVSAPAVPTQTVQTGSDGIARFAALRADTEYTIRVDISGYVSATRTVNLMGLPSIQNTDTLLLGIKLDAQRSALSGRVTNAQGQPLAEAVVSDGRQSLTTDAEGRFSLPYAEAAQIRLTVARQGFESLSRDLSVLGSQDLGNLSLQARSGPQRVTFYTGARSFGQSVEQPLTPLKAFQDELTRTGLSVRESASLDSLSESDVFVMASPALGFSADEIASIQAFVLKGGKLVMLGEWAGFGGFDATAANALLKPLGVSFGEDTLRENGSGDLVLTRFEPHAITAGLKGLSFYQSASVRADSALQARMLVRTGDNSFRIASNTGAFGVVLCALSGAGKVVLVGDTSFLSSTDSDGNGVSNLQERDNLRLGLNLINW